MTSTVRVRVDAPRRLELATGTLEVRVDRADWPLDRLCGFAARDNARRGYLVVSKLLGRHIAARPSTMRAGVRDLAAAVPRDLPGPLLVVGLAETAVCLGQTLHEELVRGGRDDALFVHSTRQRIDHPLLCRFVEPHSHAAAHLVYRPDGVGTALGDVRSLILVDDEASTGTTLANLASALRPHLPALRRIVTAVLTDWSDGAYLDRMPCPASAVSLLSGRLRWTPDLDRAARSRPRVGSGDELGTLGVAPNFGRRGVRGPLGGFEPMVAALAVPPASRVRVIGTGEFTYPPFRVAELLEAAGHDVVVQATTRSPALIGGAIGHALRFADNYGSGAANFLYNADPREDRLTVLCHETPAGSVDPALVEALGARTLGFGVA